MTATSTLCDYVLDIVNLARHVTVGKLAGATGAPQADVQDATQQLAELGLLAIDGETVSCVEG